MELIITEKPSVARAIAAAVGAAANGGPEAKGMEPYDAAKEIADAVNTYKMMMGGKNNG